MSAQDTVDPRHCQAIHGLSPVGYEPHPLHRAPSVWIEKNCYVDVWIELLNALGLEPRAALASTLAIDFEGDHWTFFKPPHAELRTLYGIDVQELNVWRPLLEHAAEHLARGRIISTEADAFWLPDTAGTDYRQQHTKTTILLNSVDLVNQRLGYFHNSAYFSLEGDDFRGLFNRDAGGLPLYAEVIRIDRAVRRADNELVELAMPLLREHVAWRPTDNPVQRFAERFNADLPELLSRGLPHYHAWAFTTLRQLGIAFELASSHLHWLAGLGHPQLSPPADHFEVIAQECKSLILKGARTVNARRDLDAQQAFAPMAQAWATGMELLTRVLQR